VKQSLSCCIRYLCFMRNTTTRSIHFAEKAMVEIKKQYASFDAKVLSKIPKGPLKEKEKD